MAITWLLLTILVTNIYHRGHERPVPEHIKKLVFVLSKIFCMSGKLQGPKVDVTSKRNNGNTNDNVKMDWRIIAKVLDRLFFVCAFVIATTSATGIFAAIYEA